MGARLPVDKKVDWPTAGFLFPVLRRNPSELAKHAFEPREICGALYELRPRFKYFLSIDL
jgi:hypothetical protein